MSSSSLPLFETYPALAEALPVLPLADLPTAVERLPAMEAELPVGSLWIKRDDRSAVPYGGNKVRKLAFLLGWAREQGYTAVLTFGAAGSNHALATGLYAPRHGLRCHAVLSPQENSPTVRKNLLGHLAAETQLHPVAGRREGHGITRDILHAEYAETGRYPFVIPPGGSSPLGIVGYINAGLELAAQIRDGILPRPDAIYVASGTMGSCVGLLIGLQCAGLDAVQVVAVRVTVAPYTSPEKARALHGTTCRMLHDMDATFPLLSFPESQFTLDDTQLGAGYGIATEAAESAVQQLKTAAGIPLEGTYTGKTFAGLIDHARQGVLAGKQVLFWDTYNSQPLEALIGGQDYRDLPEALQTYFA